MDKFRKQIVDSLYGIKKEVIPVQLVSIAKELGYTVYRFRSTFEALDISGIVNYDEKKILLNELDFNMRQRFTLAHEIGHIVLKHLENGEIVDYRENLLNPDDEKEHDANRFAVELLMPQKQFKEKFEEIKNENNFNSDDYKVITVSRLASYFITPYYATEVRVKEFRLLDYMRK